MSEVVAPDMLVSVAYRLYDEHGSEVDAVGRDEPLGYVHGYAQIVPGLEAGLEGARPGERRSIVAPPDMAFGERDEGALLEIDPRDFPGAAQAAVGDEVIAEAADGTEVAFRIIAVGPDRILVDRNHPLAGQSVRFEAEVVAVRPASDEELDAAQADVDERVVYQSTIVYGSEPSGGGETAAPPGLVQLRPKPSAEASQTPPGEEEQP